MAIDLSYTAFFYDNIKNQTFTSSNKENWKRVRSEMLIHADKANSHEITSVIIKKHPHESKSSLNYRLSVFSAITNPAFARAYNNLSRIIGDTTYVINASDTLRDTLKQRIYGGGNFRAFFQRIVLKNMIEDPNALLVWMPETAQESDNRWLIKPIIVNSNYVCHVAPDLYLFLSPYEKTLVSKGNKKVAEGEVYYMITPGGIIRFHQIGEANKFIFQDTIYAEFDFNIAGLPAMILGGVWQTSGFYESFFGAFTTWGNEALRQFSDWQVVNALHAHPLKEINPEECPGCDGEGRIYSQEKGCEIRCETCNGSGKMLNYGPMDAIVRPKPLMGEAPNNEPMVRYIQPPSDSLRDMRESAEWLLQKAEESLYLKFVNEPQSGVAKVIDRQEFINMLRDVSNQLYDLVDFSLKTLANYYGTENPAAVSVTRPKSFGIKNEDELKTDYDRLSQNMRAPNVLLDTLKELTYKTFPGDIEQKKVEVLSQYDPLYIYSPADKATLLSIGGTTEIELRNSTLCVAALERIIQRNGKYWFAETEIKLILELIEKEVQDMKGNELSNQDINFQNTSPAQIRAIFGQPNPSEGTA